MIAFVPGQPTPKPNGLASCANPHSALALTLAPLRAWLNDPRLTELCINEPGTAFLERDGAWQSESLPFADYPWCHRLARLIANASNQHIDAHAPLLSASLPTGERVQLALPPATCERCVSITIRKPSRRRYGLDELAGQLTHTRVSAGASPHHDAIGADLQQRLKANDLAGFLQAAVRHRQNILLSGATGSGKTTWTKALIREIDPSERLITIEDAAELDLSNHPNHVRLFYSKDGQGKARVQPKQLLEATLRMRPDRILLAELRGEEAYTYLRNVNSGHPGSITSLHAGSCQLALEQLVLLVKESPAGREMSRDDIFHHVERAIDVVLQVTNRNGVRAISEIHYRGAHAL